MSKLNDAQLELFHKWREESTHPSHTTVKSHELEGLIDLALRASALATALKGVWDWSSELRAAADEGDPVAISAREALAQSQAPKNTNAQQATYSHESRDSGQADDDPG